MYDENQTFIPESYTRLHQDSRHRLMVSKSELVASYELCEDMAQMLVERCQTAHFADGIDERSILERCHAGLTAPGSQFSAPQAEWVIRRAAELLEWGDWVPDFPSRDIL